MRIIDNAFDATDRNATTASSRLFNPRSHLPQVISSENHNLTMFKTEKEFEYIPRPSPPLIHHPPPSSEHQIVIKTEDDIKYLATSTSAHFSYSNDVIVECDTVGGGLVYPKPRSTSSPVYMLYGERTKAFRRYISFKKGYLSPPFLISHLCI